MLLTGFDAPIEQVMYLDRGMKGHELLQAIARVNRTNTGKTHGLVVDYYGVGHHLKEALIVYSTEDVEAARTYLTDKGCRVLRWEGVGKVCLIEDPFGIRFNLWQESLDTDQ